MVLPLRVDYIQQLTPKSIPPGLDLASLADLPNDVLAEARRVSEKLVELEARKNEESKSNRVAIRRKALLRVKPPPIFVRYTLNLSCLLGLCLTHIDCN